MIPLRYPRSGTFKFKVAAFEELPSLTFPSNHLSTSPHSLDSLEDAAPRHAYLTSSDDLSTHSASSRHTEIKICIYDRTYLLDLLEGERCLIKLEEIMKGLEVNHQTKISIKLIVVKKVMEINTKHLEIFNETVREYETYLKACF